MSENETKDVRERNGWEKTLCRLAVLKEGHSYGRKKKLGENIY